MIEFNTEVIELWMGNLSVNYASEQDIWDELAEKGNEFEGIWKTAVKNAYVLPMLSISIHLYHYFSLIFWLAGLDSSFHTSFLSSIHNAIYCCPY